MGLFGKNWFTQGNDITISENTRVVTVGPLKVLEHELSPNRASTHGSCSVFNKNGLTLPACVRKLGKDYTTTTQPLRLRHCRKKCSSQPLAASLNQSRVASEWGPFTSSKQLIPLMAFPSVLLFLWKRPPSPECNETRHVVEISSLCSQMHIFRFSYRFGLDLNVVDPRRESSVLLMFFRHSISRCIHCHHSVLLGVFLANWHANMWLGLVFFLHVWNWVIALNLQ